MHALVSTTEAPEAVLWRLFSWHVFLAMSPKKRRQVLRGMCADLESNVLPLSAPVPSRRAHVAARDLMRERLPGLLENEVMRRPAAR